MSARWAAALAAVGLAVTLAGCAAMGPAQSSFRPGATRPPGDAESYLDETIAMVAELRYDEAAARLERLLAAAKRAKARDLEARATFWLAYSREKQGKTDEAARLYKLLGESHPEARTGRQAEMRLERLKPLPGE
jgi:tetratricopeptide (TPR) repeat protein